MKNDSVFNYTYSAKEQEEIKKIREKYVGKSDETNIEKLRRLDKSVTKKATVLSITLGIIGVLVMGTGMSMCMAFEGLFIAGIIIGVIGIALVCVNYPVYIYVLKKEREKIAPEIIKLSDELMK